MFEGVEGHGHMSVNTAAPSTSQVVDKHSHEQSKQQPIASTSPQQDVDEAVRVGDIVLVKYRKGNPAQGYESHVVVEWEGGSIGDMVADAVIAVILQAAGEPPGAARAEEARRKALAAQDIDAAVAAELQLIAALLRAQFGPATIDTAAETITLMVDNSRISIDHKTSKVTGGHEQLRQRVEKAVLRVCEAMRPCELDFED